MPNILVPPRFIKGVFARRANFGNFLNRRRLHGIAVEIGVHQGQFAEEFLRQWKGSLYIGVDPWLDSFADTLRNRRSTRMEDYQICVRRLTKFGSRVCLCKTTSEIASTILPNNLSFVYIDGNHDEVLKDVSLWYGKLVNGGILAGHDIEFSQRENRSTPYKWQHNVVEALNKVVPNTQIHLVYEPGTPWSWYVEKP